MTSTSGTCPSDFSRNAARCSTPKRCCSSTTTAPRLAKSTRSWISAWVPIAMSIDPSANPAMISLRALPVTRLVNSSTRSGRSPKRLPGSGTSRPPISSCTPVACCSASTSVGAINAPWCPPCTAASSIDTATTVLPDPTSPCSRRCIGCGEARSPPISAITRCWAPVNGYGNASWKRRTSSPSTVCTRPCEVRSSSRLRRTSTSCTRSSSSKARRRRAISFSRIESGAWIDRSAAPRSTSPSRSSTDAGTGSAMPRSRQRRSASSTQPASLPRGDLRLLALRVDGHDAAGPVADEVDDRVRHLQTAPVRVGLAEQRDLQALLQLALAPRLVEEDDIHAARPVADRDVDHRSPIARHPLGHRSHRDQDEGFLAGHQIGDPRLVRPVDPPARIRRHEVEHGVDADAASDACFLSPTPFSRSTGMSANSRSVIGFTVRSFDWPHSTPNRYG